MKLYHATSRENWKRINKEGLKAFPINTETYDSNCDYLPERQNVGKGIWFSFDPEYISVSMDNPVILEVDVKDILQSSCGRIDVDQCSGELIVSQSRITQPTIPDSGCTIQPDKLKVVNKTFTKN